MAMTGSVIQACYGSRIIAKGRCVIFNFGGAHIERECEAMVIDQYSLGKQPNLIATARRDGTYGDNTVLIVMPGVQVKTGNNCHILAFQDAIVETGDNSRVITEHGCVVKCGDNGFVRTGNRSRIYAGSNVRVRCGDFCIARTGSKCSVKAGQGLNSRLFGAE